MTTTKTAALILDEVAHRRGDAQIMVNVIEPGPTFPEINLKAVAATLARLDPERARQFYETMAPYLGSCSSFDRDQFESAAGLTVNR